MTITSRAKGIRETRTGPRLSAWPKKAVPARFPGFPLFAILFLWLSLAAPGEAPAQWCSCDRPGWSGPLIFDWEYRPKEAFKALSRELGGSGDSKTGLRTLAQGRLLLGTALRFEAVRSDRRYTEVLLPQFNLVTPESALKFDQIHPQGLASNPADPMGYDFSRADQLIGLAAANSLKARGHTLVWHGYLPEWVTQASADQLPAIFTNHILRVVGRYKDHRGADGTKTMIAYDVVNEAVNDEGQLRSYDGLWGKFGGTEAEPAKLEFIRLMFETAFQADPETKLFYNDFGCFTNKTKLDKVLSLAAWLKGVGAPIHGVGFQTHLTATDEGIGEKIRETARTLEAMGLEMQITEMDVRFQDCRGTEESQGQVYAEVLRECLGAANCTAFNLWGFTDRYTWFQGCDNRGRRMNSVSRTLPLSPK